MKRTLVAGLAALGLSICPVSFGAPSPIWENWAQITVPSPAYPSAPMIDAVTFINHAGAQFNLLTSSLYNTYETLNYTNQGLISANPGFDFQWVPPSTGVASNSVNFVNKASGPTNSSGVINANGALTFILNPLPFGNLTGSSKVLVDADNIINSGSINMSASSLIRLRGKNIDLTGGALTMANPSDTFGFFSSGVLDGYWGVGTADFRYFNVPSVGQASLLNPAALLQSFGGTTVAVSDTYNITDRNFFALTRQQFLVNPSVYYHVTSDAAAAVTSNRWLQVVVLLETNNLIANQIYFPGADDFNPSQEIIVQWQWTSTNFPSGAVSTNNYMYLFDNFGEVTNIGLVVNGFAGVHPTFSPENYFFSPGAFSTLPGEPAVAPTQVPFIPGIVTNQYAAYEGIFTAGTQLATDVAGGNVTNLAGRIELTASKTLNLAQARISSLNYLLVKATNHYLGSPRATIAAPNMDLYLRTTNGALAITNLVAPYLNHPEGICELWSARWTNNTTETINGNVATITNSVHVLFVNSQLSPVTIPKVQTLDLTVTNFVGGPNNLTISDQINVTGSAKLRAERITITTNSGNMFAPVGKLNFLDPGIIWSDITPGLMYLTNNGSITAQNAVYFGGSRTQPPYNTNLVDIPYNAFVNRGGISNQADLVWSSYFENDGIFDAGFGSFVLQKCLNAALLNGAILAPNGEVTLNAGSMLVSNHLLVAGSALTLNVTNYLSDGSIVVNGGSTTYSADGVTNKNFWVAGSGFNLPVLPTASSLLGTTVSNIAPDYQLVVNQWAGRDLGNTPAGFNNNAALGHLILDGNIDCTFEFQPATGNNALYVDLLEFRNFIASNEDASGNFSSVIVDPGMNIYFGNALANGQSIAEKLPLVNGGHFFWVSNYNTGFFSSTNVVYSDGSTNRLNTALVQSCDIDSNGNGVPNCSDRDPIPLMTPGGLGLKVTLKSTPSPAALLSWTAFPYTTNYLYYVTAPAATNWKLLTNFVYPGSLPNRVTITNVIGTNGPRFYRVKIGSP